MTKRDGSRSSSGSARRSNAKKGTATTGSEREGAAPKSTARKSTARRLPAATRSAPSHVNSRAEARSPAKVRILDDADAVFITGGDQLKLTSQLGDSPIYERLRDIYESGGTIAGTSAGASVVCETTMVSGTASESHTIASALRMAPGFGLISGVIIDQHFAERGRIGRLIAAVSQNPRMLGVGIDEDTAIVCDQTTCFHVIGTGGVTVVDAADVQYSNIADEESDRTLSVFGLRVHQLSMGDVFSLETRKPENHPAEETEHAIMAAAR